jgi:predicted nucleotide-binding protein
MLHYRRSTTQAQKMTARPSRKRSPSRSQPAGALPALVEESTAHEWPALSVEELAKLPLSSRKVVFTACQTALSIGDRDLTVSGSNAHDVLEVSRGLAEYLLTANQDVLIRDFKTRRKRSDRRCKKVFVVHGHDESSREAVARFLEKIGLEAIILAEQTNDGRTIIEKFEEHAVESAYAVVLATPDDFGGPIAGPAASRPRQNVIFELGFFVGRLGRQRVCLLRKGDLEGFSDFQGVIYTDLDAQGAWKLRLARELENAGLPVDMAKAARA